MSKIEHEEDVIDLGVASNETKGVGLDAPDTIQGQKQYPPMGLCAD